jgi:hypothetical protein
MLGRTGLVRTGFWTLKKWKLFLSSFPLLFLSDLNEMKWKKRAMSEMLDGAIRRVVVIGNGFAGAENQSIGLVRALGLSNRLSLYVSHCSLLLIIIILSFHKSIESFGLVWFGLISARDEAARRN